MSDYIDFPLGRRPARTNGLDADRFSPLLDVDPRVVGVLLDALRQAGIPAYVEPSPGSRGGYLEVRLPDRPTDRLWVDGRLTPQARTVVEAELAEFRDQLAAAEGQRRPAGATPEDAAWAEIVASWDTPAAGVASWPAAEDVPPEPPGQPGGHVIRPADRREPPPPLTPAFAPAADPLDDTDDHYVPPPPPPLPKLSASTLWALVAAALGLLLLFAPQAIGLLQSPLTFGAGVLSLIGAAGTLIWRMRDTPPSDTDSDSDDGAVV